MTTIYDLLTELQSFGEIDELVLLKASTSNINSESNERFEELSNDWNRGMYDDCPSYLFNV